MDENNKPKYNLNQNDGEEYKIISNSNNDDLHTIESYTSLDYTEEEHNLNFLKLKKQTTDSLIQINVTEEVEGILNLLSNIKDNVDVWHKEEEEEKFRMRISTFSLLKIMKLIGMDLDESAVFILFTILNEIIVHQHSLSQNSVLNIEKETILNETIIVHQHSLSQKRVINIEKRIDTELFNNLTHVSITLFNEGGELKKNEEKKTPIRVNRKSIEKIISLIGLDWLEFVNFVKIVDQLDATYMKQKSKLKEVLQIDPLHIKALEFFKIFHFIIHKDKEPHLITKYSLHKISKLMGMNWLEIINFIGININNITEAEENKRAEKYNLLFRRSILLEYIIGLEKSAEILEFNSLEKKVDSALIKQDITTLNNSSNYIQNTKTEKNEEEEELQSKNKPEIQLLKGKTTKAILINDNEENMETFGENMETFEENMETFEENKEVVNEVNILKSVNMNKQIDIDYEEVEDNFGNKRLVDKTKLKTVLEWQQVEDKNAQTALIKKPYSKFVNLLKKGKAFITREADEEEVINEKGNILKVKKFLLCENNRLKERDGECYEYVDISGELVVVMKKEIKLPVIEIKEEEHISIKKIIRKYNIPIEQVFEKVEDKFGQNHLVKKIDLNNKNIKHGDEYMVQNSKLIYVLVKRLSNSITDPVINEWIKCRDTDSNNGFRFIHKSKLDNQVSSSKSEYEEVYETEDYNGIKSNLIIEYEKIKIEGITYLIDDHSWYLVRDTNNVRRLVKDKIPNFDFGNTASSIEKVIDEFGKNREVNKNEFSAKNCQLMFKSDISNKEGWKSIKFNNREEYMRKLIKVGQTYTTESDRYLNNTTVRVISKIQRTLVIDEFIPNIKPDEEIEVTTLEEEKGYDNLLLTYVFIRSLKEKPIKTIQVTLIDNRVLEQKINSHNASSVSSVSCIKDISFFDEKNLLHQDGEVINFNQIDGDMNLQCSAISMDSSAFLKDSMKPLIKTLNGYNLGNNKKKIINLLGDEMIMNYNQENNSLVLDALKQNNREKNKEIKADFYRCLLHPINYYLTEIKYMKELIESNQLFEGRQIEIQNIHDNEVTSCSNDLNINLDTERCYNTNKSNLDPSTIKMKSSSNYFSRQETRDYIEESYLDTIDNNAKELKVKLSEDLFTYYYNISNYKEVYEDNNFNADIKKDLSSEINIIHRSISKIGSHDYLDKVSDLSLSYDIGTFLHIAYLNKLNKLVLKKKKKV